MDINELTYQIRGAVFEVNRIRGSGFLEKVYEKALLIEFRSRGLKAESQIPIVVKYKGREVGEYFADVRNGGRWYFCYLNNTNLLHRYGCERMPKKTALCGPTRMILV